MEKESIEKTPLDFNEIVKKLLDMRKQFLVWVPLVTVASFLFLCTLPRYYKSVVLIAPESDSSVSSALDNFGSLAASFGLGSLSKIGNNDAIYSEIYPELIASNDFLARLMPVEITTIDSLVYTNFYTYISEKSKKVWWEYISNVILGIFKKKEIDLYKGEGVMPTFRITKKQYAILKYMKKNITCEVDRKTDIITIEVTDNDPLVAALMAKATCENLQDFIVDYRTNKSRIDYNYYKKLVAESKSEYEEAMSLYSDFADSHNKAILTSYRVKLGALEDEMRQKYNIYTTLESSMRAAERKLQENTPAFTILENASVAIKPAGPKRIIISIFMGILTFFALSLFILIKK